MKKKCISGSSEDIVVPQHDVHKIQFVPYVDTVLQSWILITLITASILSTHCRQVLYK